MVIAPVLKSKGQIPYGLAIHHLIVAVQHGKYPVLCKIEPQKLKKGLNRKN